MAFTHNPEDLARVLPGTWKIGATNFSMWRGGARADPHFRYELRSEDPLSFDDFVSWTTAKGKSKTIVGTDHFTGDEFIWKGRGLLAPFSSHWSITGITADESVMVLRFSKSILTSAGVDVIIREGADASELRATVARGSEALGLTHSEFASLTWLAIS